MIVTGSRASLKALPKWLTWQAAIAGHRHRSGDYRSRRSGYTVKSPLADSDNVRQRKKQEQGRTDSQAEGKSEWKKRPPAYESSRHASRAENIVAGDLEATVEAHKAANKASLIRYHRSKSPESSNTTPVGSESFRRLDINQGGGSRMETEDAKETPSESASDAEVTTPKILFRRPSSQEKQKGFDPWKLHGYWTTPPDSVTGHEDLRPWTKVAEPKAKSYKASTWQEFEIAVDQFLSWMQLTPCEQTASDNLSNRVMGFIKDTVPNLASQPHGLRCIGIGQPLDRIEIVVFDPSSELIPPNPLDMQEDYSPQSLSESNILKRLRNEFAKNKQFTTRPSRSGNLVHLRDNATSLQVNLTMGKKYMLRRDMQFRDLLSTTANAKKIHMLLQQALRMRGLPPSSIKGENDRRYGLLGMVIFALRLKNNLQEGGRTPGTVPSDDAGFGPSLLSDLLHVLAFWMEQPLHKNVYVIDPIEIHPKRMTNPQISALRKASENPDSTHWKALQIVCAMNRIKAPPPELAGQTQLHGVRPSILDPSIPGIDLGKNLYTITMIIKIFEALHERLSAILHQSHSADIEDRTQLANDCLDLFTLGNWSSYVGQRSKVEYRGMALQSHNWEKGRRSMNSQSSKAADEIRRLARMDRTDHA